MLPDTAAPGFRHVFSDMDNTLVHYATKHLYPGALRFVHELRGDMDSAEGPLFAPKLMLLSARPERSAKHLEELQQRFAVDGFPVLGGVLYGKVRDCLFSDLGHDDQQQGDWAICEALADRKVKNLKRWAEELRPTAPVVFVGDNGEGDVLAAKRLLEDRVIHAAFIRRLGPNERVVFFAKRPCSMEHENLFFFSDYVEAADIAFQHGFISKSAQQRVLVEAEMADRATSPKERIVQAMLHHSDSSDSPDSDAVGRSSVERWANRTRLGQNLVVGVRMVAHKVAEHAPADGRPRPDKGVHGWRG